MFKMKVNQQKMANNPPCHPWSRSRTLLHSWNLILASDRDDQNKAAWLNKQNLKGCLSFIISSWSSRILFSVLIIPTIPWFSSSPPNRLADASFVVRRTRNTEVVAPTNPIVATDLPLKHDTGHLYLKRLSQLTILAFDVQTSALKTEQKIEKI